MEVRSLLTIAHRKQTLLAHERVCAFCGVSLSQPRAGVTAGCSLRQCRMASTRNSASCLVLHDRYSDMDNRLDVLEAMLGWRHMVPTAPDTLAAMPLSETDPFILTSAPAVFFAGCQPSYGTRLVTGVPCPLPLVFAST